MPRKKMAAAPLMKVFSLTVEEHALLVRAAQAEDRSIVAVVRRALAMYLGRHHKDLLPRDG
jgi:hypothetical protein